MDRMLSDKRVILILVLPAFLVFLIFIPAPVVMSFLLSFVKWDMVGEIKFIGLNNFKFLFQTDYVFWTSVRNTLVFVVSSAILQLPMAFLLANILSRVMKGKSFFRNIIFLPVTFSGVSVSLMFYFVYHPEVGLLNRLLDLIGITTNMSWLGNEKTALLAVVFTLAWQWTGYHMVIFIAGITNIPLELMEAAKIDGCSEWKLTWNVIFPLILPVVKVSSVLIVTSSLKAFDMIYIMTFGGPNHASEVLASHMYTKTFAQMKFGYGSAIATVLMFLCIGSTVLINKMFKARDIV